MDNYPVGGGSTLAIAKESFDGLWIDDSELYLPLVSDVCSHCAHWFVEPGAKCKAFPNGIPVEIWEGRNKHTEPYEGDHGIQFEQKVWD